MRYLLICASFTVAVATACTSRTEAPPAMDSTEVPSSAARDSLLPVRTLLNEFSSGITDSTRVVFTDSATWWDAYARIYMNHGRLPGTPSVDFVREMVVLVALGERASGGYSVGIDSARATPTEVMVFVRTTLPGPTCMTTAALTQPVHAVALPRTALPVQFVEQSTVNNCV